VLESVSSDKSLLRPVITAVIAVGLLGVIGYGYHGLRQSIVANGEMAKTIIRQNEEIAQQRSQIKSFTSKIRSLEDRLVELNAFEEKIRVLINLDAGNEHSELNGVGGAMPDDLDFLDSKLEPRQGHGALLEDMGNHVNELSSAARFQEERFGTLMGALKDRRNFLDATPSIRPTSGWLSSRFGYRISPFTGRRELHKGIDIANRKGTDILATADGVVSFSGKNGSMGRMIVIDHGHGIITRFAHLDSSLKKKGDSVKRGEIIAKMGNSGRSTGPHLHYEVHRNGVPVNPANFILD
jgi:murein DD-endopeptidase MepM/ murein hydrolase activator NlpD